MSRTWRDVWSARSLDPTKASTLEQLMAADGLDTGFSSVTETAWRRFVQRSAATLDARPGMSVFEVGCGAGAFSYPLVESGYRVGGLDQSATLLRHAAQVMPQGRWTQCDASEMDTREPSDVVLACGVFMYFSCLDYARRVLARMAAKATRAIAILDVPDLDTKADALALRRGSLGDAAYEARYAGLDHLYFDRSWMLRALVEIGATSIRIEDQRVDGHQSGRFRFNAFAWF